MVSESPLLQVNDISLAFGGVKPQRDANGTVLLSRGCG